MWGCGFDFGNQKRQKNKINKGHSIEIDVKLSLFTDYLHGHMKNPKVHQKPIKLINEFIKVAQHKINISKSLGLLYASNEVSKIEIKKVTPIAGATKQKPLWINLRKEMKEL